MPRFDDARQPGYDERTDIWRLPDTLDVLLGAEFESAAQLPFPEEVVVKALRGELRRRCRSPREARPQIREVASMFLTINQVVVAHLKLALAASN